MTKIKIRYLLYIALLVLNLIIFLGIKSNSSDSITQQQTIMKTAENQAAHFEFGNTIWVDSFNVDEKGGVLEVGNIGTPIDGAEISVPAGVLKKKSIMQVGYNDGELHLASGFRAGGVLVLDFQEDPAFQKKPIYITIHFDPSLYSSPITGYAIDSKGKLHGLTCSGYDRENGKASFYSFKPLTMTWLGRISEK